MSVEAIEVPWPRTGYAWRVVAVLTAAYTLSFIDRQILGLVLEPIRRGIFHITTSCSRASSRAATPTWAFA